MFFESTSLNVVFTLLAILFAVLYYYVKRVYSFWKRLGVVQLRPIFPFGNLAKVFIQRKSIFDVFEENYYAAASEPFVGTYIFLKPSLQLRDPELIRTVMVKDAAHFMDRGVYVDEKNDPISAHLFALEGDQWKNLRVKLTPTFTSGKMKAMFSTILASTDTLVKFIEQRINDPTTADDSFEARDMCGCFTTNNIASVAFGIDTNCFGDPENPFRKYGRRIFEATLKNGFRMFCFILSPTMLKWSGLRFCDRDVERFFRDMVIEMLELREQKKIVRKDFFQLLVQLRNSGSVELDDEWHTVITNDNDKSLTIEQLTAQAMLFFVAGFETSSSTMSFCLYEIAKDADIQRRVHAEIDAVLAKTDDGQFTYESLNELTYLECCIDEALRKYPVVPGLNRRCTKEYTLPGTNIVLPVGTNVGIPTISLHNDPKYYPNPKRFDPERFSAANKSGKTFNDMPYLPFGDGPRNCIGMRMGKLFTKVGVAIILQKFRIELDARRHTENELTFAKDTIIPMAVGGINLKIQHRK